MRVSLFARKNVLLQRPIGFCKRTNLLCRISSWYHLFFPESSHLQAQQDTKANALISLCGNGHNTVQTYLLLFFQSDAPRCIHDKRCSAPLTSRQLSVSSFLSLLLLFFAFMNLSYQRMRGLSRTFYLEMG